VINWGGERSEKKGGRRHTTPCLRKADEGRDHEGEEKGEGACNRRGKSLELVRPRKKREEGREEERKQADPSVIGSDEYSRRRRARRREEETRKKEGGKEEGGGNRSRFKLGPDPTALIFVEKEGKKREKKVGEDG